jgi:hypothetical protein
MKLASFVGVLISLIVIGAIVGQLVAQHVWETRSGDIIENLDREATSQDPITAAELDSLPPLVARYLEAVLPEDRVPIRMARLQWQGEFLLVPKPKGWRPFRAREVFTSHPPGYIWDARIRSGSVTVFVRDGFAGGAGFMRGAIAGLVPVVNQHDTPEIAAGALQRYLAETVWFPSALLPREGVTWSGVNDTTARATLTANGISVSLDFRFGPDGMVRSVYTPARYHAESGGDFTTPWLGHFGGYEEHEGVRIPASGEVEWILPGGPQPYWRGQIRSARFLR